MLTTEVCSKWSIFYAYVYVFFFRLSRSSSKLSLDRHLSISIFGCLVLCVKYSPFNHGYHDDLYQHSVHSLGLGENRLKNDAHHSFSYGTQENETSGEHG